MKTNIWTEQNTELRNASTHSIYKCHIIANKHRNSHIVHVRLFWYLYTPMYLIIYIENCSIPTIDIDMMLRVCVRSISGLLMIAICDFKQTNNLHTHLEFYVFCFLLFLFGHLPRTYKIHHSLSLTTPNHTIDVVPWPTVRYVRTSLKFVKEKKNFRKKKRIYRQDITENKYK